MNMISYFKISDIWEIQQLDKSGFQMVSVSGCKMVQIWETTQLLDTYTY